MSLLLPWWWRWAALALALVAAAAFGAAKMHEHDQSRYDALQAQFEAFKDQTAALGREAKARTVAQEKADKEAKEKADAENSDALAALAGTIGKLRRSGAGSRGLPATPAPAGRPDLACYDRAILSGAYGTLVEEVRGGADEGSKATVDLNTAKLWVRGLKMSHKLSSIGNP